MQSCTVFVCPISRRIMPAVANGVEGLFKFATDHPLASIPLVLTFNYFFFINASTTG